MLKHVVEAYSPISYEEALFTAMDKASAFLSGRQSDAHVAIKSLNHSEAQGYHAVLEITLVPISLRDNMHITGQFKETAHALVRNYRLMLKAEHDHMQHVLEDHFAKTHGPLIHRDIPDAILVPLHDAEIENHMLEQALNPSRGHHHNPDDPEPE